MNLRMLVEHSQMTQPINISHEMFNVWWHYIYKKKCQTFQETLTKEKCAISELAGVYM